MPTMQPPQRFHIWTTDSGREVAEAESAKEALADMREYLQTQPASTGQGFMIWLDEEAHVIHLRRNGAGDVSWESAITRAGVDPAHLDESAWDAPETLADALTQSLAQRRRAPSLPRRETTSAADLDEGLLSMG